MKAFQGKIKLEERVISKISQDKGYVEIELYDKKYKFRNCFVYPGFVDSHGHIASLGIKLNSLQLNDCKCQEECIEKALKHTEYRGDWLIGYGWNNENWDCKDFPQSTIIDEYFKDVPVCFFRVDGHSIWVNSKALEIAGIYNSKANVKGGRIIKRKNGKPSGILLDNAMELVTKHIPKYTEEQISRYIIDGIQELNKNGITEVHDMDTHPDLVKLYKELSLSGVINLRIYSYIKAQNDEYLTYISEPFYSDFFSVIGIKLYMDGALGSRGAALLESYSDLKETKGLLLLKEKKLHEKILKAISRNFQVAVHSIGDRANRIALKAFEKVIIKNNSHNIPYLRLEHAQIIHPEDLKYLSNNRIIPSVQPIHCISDAEMAISRLGARCQYAYPWKSLIQSSNKLLGGSDFPIESHNPFLGISSFINRIENDEIAKFFSDERISIKEALDAYMIYPRQICFNECKTGKIEKGQRGDFIILNKELENMKDVKVIATFVDGKIVYFDQSFVS